MFRIIPVILFRQVYLHLCIHVRVLRVIKKHQLIAMLTYSDQYYVVIIVNGCIFCDCKRAKGRLLCVPGRVQRYIPRLADTVILNLSKSLDVLRWSNTL